MTLFASMPRGPFDPFWVIQSTTPPPQHGSALRPDAKIAGGLWLEQFPHLCTNVLLCHVSDIGEAN